MGGGNTKILRTDFVTRNGLHEGHRVVADVLLILGLNPTVNSGNNWYGRKWKWNDRS